MVVVACDGSTTTAAAAAGWRPRALTADIPDIQVPKAICCPAGGSTTTTTAAVHAVDDDENTRFLQQKEVLQYLCLKFPHLLPPPPPPKLKPSTSDHNVALEADAFMLEGITTTTTTTYRPSLCSATSPFGSICGSKGTDNGGGPSDSGCYAKKYNAEKRLELSPLAVARHYQLVRRHMAKCQKAHTNNVRDSTTDGPRSMTPSITDGLLLHMSSSAAAAAAVPTTTCLSPSTFLFGTMQTAPHAASSLSVGQQQAPLSGPPSRYNSSDFYPRRFSVDCCDADFIQPDVTAALEQIHRPADSQLQFRTGSGCDPSLNLFFFASTITTSTEDEQDSPLGRDAHDEDDTENHDDDTACSSSPPPEGGPDRPKSTPLLPASDNRPQQQGLSGAAPENQWTAENSSSSSHTEEEQTAQLSSEWAQRGPIMMDEYSFPLHGFAVGADELRYPERGGGGGGGRNNPNRNSDFYGVPVLQRFISPLSEEERWTPRLRGINSREGEMSGDGDMLLLCQEEGESGEPVGVTTAPPIVTSSPFVMSMSEEQDQRTSRNNSLLTRRARNGDDVTTCQCDNIQCFQRNSATFASLGGRISRASSAGDVCDDAYRCCSCCGYLQQYRQRGDRRRKQREEGAQNSPVLSLSLAAALSEVSLCPIEL